MRRVSAVPLASVMELPASMNDRRFQALPAVGQLLLSVHTANLSEDGEIFNFADDDDLPSSTQILASLKQVPLLLRATGWAIAVAALFPIRK
jgi:hypothetical protein